MISKFSIANFKAFGEKLQEIPIRPITLIFGPNSSGKSSLLHSLLLIHHAMETGDLNANRLSIGGDSVALGGFNGYIHRHLNENRLTYKIEIDISKGNRLFPDVEVPTDTSSKFEIGITIGLWGLDKSKDSELETGYTKDVVVQAFWVDLNGESLFEFSYRDDNHLHLDSFNYDHTFFENQLRELIISFTTTSEISEDDYNIITKRIDQLVEMGKAPINGIFPGKCVFKDEIPDENSPEKFFAISKGNRQGDIKQAIDFFFPRLLNSTLDNIIQLINVQLHELHYLGPLRTYPPRHVAFSPDSNMFNEANGGKAWRLLLDDSGLREKVSKWLNNDKNDTKYKILKTSYINWDGALLPLSKSIENLDLAVTPRDDFWKEAASKWRPNENNHEIPEEISSFLDKEYIKRYRDLLTQFLDLKRQRIITGFIDELVAKGIVTESDSRWNLINLKDDLLNQKEEGQIKSEKDKTVIYKSDFEVFSNLPEKHIDQMVDMLNSIIYPAIEIDTKIKYIDDIIDFADGTNSILNIEFIDMDQPGIKDTIKRNLTEDQIREEIEKLNDSPEVWLGDKFENEINMSDPDKAIEDIRNDVLRSDVGREPDLILIDQLRNNTAVTLRDVGIGISQVIPVITYANSFKKGLISIEQPELHLHPALQAELGDLFIESALGDSKNTLLIETHSEHLILRILRRIRETFETSQQKAPPKIENPITPDDVSVIYAKPTKDGTKLYNMKITEDGNFEKDWPDGFFEERLEEFR